MRHPTHPPPPVATHLAVDEKLETFELVIEELERNVKGLHDQEQKAAKAREERMDRELRQRQHEEEIKRERVMLQLKHDFKKKSDNANQKFQASMVSEAKLPKLLLTKFQGTHIYWQRFWNQFEAEIDRADIS